MPLGMRSIAYTPEAAKQDRDQHDQAKIGTGRRDHVPPARRRVRFHCPLSSHAHGLASAGFAAGAFRHRPVRLLRILVPSGRL